MKEEHMENDQAPRARGGSGSGGGILGGIYGMAFIGAAIYFIQHAPTFWAGVLGFLKAIIWPVLLIYKLLEFLKM
jgi:hypothetical protein